MSERALLARLTAFVTFVALAFAPGQPGMNDSLTVADHEREKYIPGGLVLDVTALMAWLLSGEGLSPLAIVRLLTPSIGWCPRHAAVTDAAALCPRCSPRRAGLQRSMRLIRLHS
jgi:hypothetical protein